MVSVSKKRILSNIKYPRLTLLVLSFFLAYFIFEGRNFTVYHNLLVYLNYFGVFIAGLFYAYGFTAAPATAVLLTIAKENNFIISVLIGGLGALLGDLIIFFFIRKLFTKEIKKLSKNKYIHYLEEEEKKVLGHFQKYVLPVFAGFLIASPLPTEIGVSIFASLKKMSVLKFAVLAYILHTIGIFIILFIGTYLI